MAATELYIAGSVLLTALLSFIGIVSVSVREQLLRRIVLYLVSFSAGALFGTVFLRMIPRIAGEYGFGLAVGSALLSGIVLSYATEAYLHWHHHAAGAFEASPFSYVLLLGDGIHNFIDGLIIATAYFVAVPLGVATTAAVVLHKIPKEIGDFGVLLHGGLSLRKALLYNFTANLAAFVGAGTVVLMAGTEPVLRFLIAFAAGTFIYVAGSDLLPEVKEETDTVKATFHILSFLAGILVILILTL